MGTPMTAGMYLTIILMATLVSIGTAGIPSVSLFLAATTLSVIGATPEQIVVVIAVLWMTYAAPETKGRELDTLTDTVDA